MKSQIQRLHQTHTFYHVDQEEQHKSRETWNEMRSETLEIDDRILWHDDHKTSLEQQINQETKKDIDKTTLLQKKRRSSRSETTRR